MSLDDGDEIESITFDENIETRANPVISKGPTEMEYNRITETLKHDRIALGNYQIFGNLNFRPNQRKAIEAAMKPNCTFSSLILNCGKSLCYQLPACLSPGITVVVSPLLSLVQDQVTALVTARCGGIPATHLGSNCTETEAKRQEQGKQRFFNNPQNISSTSYPICVCKLIYVTPEKLENRDGKFNSILMGLNEVGLLRRFVIDEAHCVSKWGHDFRPAYKKLSRLRRDFKQVPIMALTATATPAVKDDLKKPLVISQSFNRTNLSYSVIDKPSDPYDAVEHLSKYILHPKRSHV
eukprot:GSMAST32.ASY1.ANO1.2353.1 assembled CDS